MASIYKDHYPLESPGFKGAFARGRTYGAIDGVNYSTQKIPYDHFLSATNVLCKGEEVTSRPPFTMLNDIAIPAGRTIKRFRLYRKSTGSRYLILLDNRDFYDSDDMTTALLTAPAGTTDFSMTVMFDRAYITFHDGSKGISGDVVRVYDGTTIRDAGGTAPTTDLAAADGAAGKVEAGLHKFGYIFESDTGFYSQISPVKDHTAAGSKKVDLSSIDVGPSGTVARHIVATKVMLANEEPEYFFVPGGEVAGNVATTLTVDFYDSELVDSADYLLDIEPEIPAGVGIGVYGSRMMVWGENANPNYVRISEPGEPEVFNSIDGFVSTAPNEGGGTVKFCFVQRTQLYICKDFRTEVTSDNGDAPSSWDLNLVDAALGAGANSVGGIFEADENVAYDLTFVANPAGLWLFNGRFADTPLSWKYHDKWMQIEKSRFDDVQVIVDVYEELIFVLIPIGEGTDYCDIYVCNYEDAIDADSVRWHEWRSNGLTVVCAASDVDSDTKRSTILFGCTEVSLDTGIYKIDYKGEDTEMGADTDSTALVAYGQSLQFPYVSYEDAYETHYNALKLKVGGDGTLRVNIRNMADTNTFLGDIALVAAQSARHRLLEFNYVAEKASIIISNSGIMGFRISDAILYVKEHSFDIPQAWK